MPGQHRLSVDELAREAERLLESGVRALLLFGLPESKDAEGSGAWADDGIVQRAARAVRGAVGDDLAIVADVCLCEYTSHGHCGVLRADGVVDNDLTLESLARASIDNVFANGPSAALTGPIVRGDAETVAAHMDALDEAPPTVAALYVAAARRLIEIARERDLPEASVRALESVLGSVRLKADTTTAKSA